MNQQSDGSLPSTKGMTDYNDHSHMQDQSVLSKGPKLQELVRDIGVIPDGFVMQDLGCGPGRSTVDAAKPVVAAYRELTPDGLIVVRHSDQPGNDWSAVFERVFGPDGYRHGVSSVRSEAAVGTFYEQLADTGSVALSTCFAASHWLRNQVNVDAPNTVFFSEMEGEARARFREQALADWTLFLRQRARELRPGGYLMVSTLGSVPDPAAPNGIRGSGVGIYRAIHIVAEDMVADGLLSRAILDRFAFGLWFLTEAESAEAIDAAADLGEMFERCEMGVQPAAYQHDDLYRNHLGDPEAYGAAYAGYVRGFGESTLRMHLFAPSATPQMSEDDLCTEFFRRYQVLYENHPGTYAFEAQIFTLIMRRR